MHIIRVDNVYAMIAGLLEEKPNKVYVGKEFMALWVLGWEKALIIVGEFSESTDEEIRDAIVKHMSSIIDERGL